MVESQEPKQYRLLKGRDVVHSEYCEHLMSTNHGPNSTKLRIKPVPLTDISV